MGRLQAEHRPTACPGREEGKWYSRLHQQEYSQLTKGCDYSLARGTCQATPGLIALLSPCSKETLKNQRQTGR